SSRRRHTRFSRDWSSDVCSSDLVTTYGTSGTPVTMALTDALAEVEGAGHACRAALMPSGLSAISTALFAFLSPGDHLLVSDSVRSEERRIGKGCGARGAGDQ